MLARLRGDVLDMRALNSLALESKSSFWADVGSCSRVGICPGSYWMMTMQSSMATIG